MKKRIISIILGITILVGIGFFTMRVKKSSVKEVRVSDVSKGEVRSYLSTTAIVKSKQSKDYFGPQLKISKVNVKLGDVVKKGQALISYDITDLDLQLKQAQIQYDNAILQRNELNNQKQDLNNKIKNLDDQIATLENSKNPSEQAMLSNLKQQRAALQPISSEKVKQVDNSVELAKASLENIKSKYNSVKDGVVADFDGAVTLLNAVEGAIGNPAQPLITIQDTNNLKAVVALGKYDAEKVKIDQDVVVKSSGKEYKGKVTFVNPAATKTQSISGADISLSAEIDILDSAENLKIDFDVDVDILLGNVDNTLKIPIESVKNDKSGKNLVYTNENGVVKEKEVKLGLKSDTQVQIVEGLTEGDKVVLNPSATLKNGDKVKELSKEGK
ncbi:efflux RND transporter periplasmic adaptor subunit [Desnuesiella massiliensis]|uniref:efflux RND transporter periplasmic adaptor subunit n=1 Tax=Desnuesiella massiliensis TaxID=1650662 RepID=UPI0006E1F53D|nr:efflux RND transporter periplasmic adaptor subunit [Desnuesiella massiliensis]